MVPDEILDMKATRGNLEIIPTVVLFFIPNMILFVWSGNIINVVLFFGIIQFCSAPFSIFIDFYDGFWTMLFFSIPALIVSLFYTWMLHRLANKKTTSERVFRGVIAATIVWGIYFSIWFIPSLITGSTILPIFPLIGPIVAILCRNSIMRMTVQIDTLESSAS